MDKHSIQWNSDLWNNDASIVNNGESWSEGYGGSEAQWNNSIYPRIRKFLPAKNIVEIACGHGRWTRFLVKESIKYFGFDISKQALDFCKNSFSFDILNNKVEFYLNDGKSLKEVQSNSIDFIFSFDSLVHANMDAIGPYLIEFERVLKEDGRIFLHHSNMAYYSSDKDILSLTGDDGRSPYVDSVVINSFCEQNGLKIICQEKLPWGERAGKNRILTDCFSLIGKTRKQDEFITDNFNYFEETLSSIQINKIYY